MLMKSLIFNLTILLFIILPSLASVEDTNYNLTVDIVNIAIIKGELCFAVYNDEASFKQKKKSATMVIPVKRSSERVSFRLPAGEYSVVVVQDINGNRKMDYFLSLPIETIWSI